MANITGGTITANSWFDLGRDSGTGHGTLNQSGGTINNRSADTLIIRDPSTVGVWNMSGGTANLRFLQVGRGNGTLNITNPSAVITVSNEMQVGRDGGHGDVHQSAGTVSAGGGWFGIPNDGTNPSGLVDGLNGTVVTKTGQGTRTVESAIDTVGPWLSMQSKASRTLNPARRSTRWKLAQEER